MVCLVLQSLWGALLGLSEFKFGIGNSSGALSGSLGAHKLVTSSMERDCGASLEAACLLACLLACVLACLCACLLVCLRTCLRACVRASERACVRACVRARWLAGSLARWLLLI